MGNPNIDKLKLYVLGLLCALWRVKCQIISAHNSFRICLYQ